MSVTLALAKAHLRVLHDDDDVLIASHINSAQAQITKFIGDEIDPYADELTAAQLLLIEWLFDPSQKVDLDDIHQMPRAVVALASPYRTPTVA